MTELLTSNEGQTALELARTAIEEYLGSGEVIKTEGVPDLPPIFQNNRGVFVTLNNRSGSRRELRGCIGRPYPVMPLGEAIVISAINAATEDPRFMPVTLNELENLEVEVTVLTMPHRIEARPEELPDKIEVGSMDLSCKRGRIQDYYCPRWL